MLLGSATPRLLEKKAVQENGEWGAEQKKADREKGGMTKATAAVRRQKGSKRRQKGRCKRRRKAGSRCNNPRGERAGAAPTGGR